MKKFILTSLFTLLFVTLANANHEKINGYYITLNLYTVKANIMVHTSEGFLDGEAMRNDIEFFDSNDNVTIYTADSIKEYGFKLNNEPIIMRRIQNNFHIGGLLNEEKFIFLRLLVDGKMRYYEYDYWRFYPPSMQNPGGGIAHKNRKFLVYNGTFTEVLRINCKGNLLEFITDCPEIISRIKEKKYGYDKIPFLALDYNAICK